MSLGLLLGRVGVTQRVFFPVSKGGALRTGLVVGNFTVTLTRPDDGSNTTAAVTESTQKPGEYYFDVLGSFLTVVGDYGYVIEVSAIGPALVASAGAVLKVYANDVDSLPQDIIDTVVVC